MPRIGVDLLYFDQTAQINQHPSPRCPGLEKEVLRRLVLVFGKLTVMELVRPASIWFSFSVNHDEFCQGTRII